MLIVDKLLIFLFVLKLKNIYIISVKLSFNLLNIYETLLLMMSKNWNRVTWQNFLSYIQALFWADPKR